MSLRAATIQFACRVIGTMGRLRKPSVMRIRKSMEGGVSAICRPMKSVKMEDVDLGGVPSLRFIPPSVEREDVLYFLHGGGYISCSPRLYAGLISRLALALGVVAYAPDYRLAPEHVMPAAQEDCLAAYRALQAERIFIGGDSAGGGLTLSTLQALDSSEMPAAAFTISAHADMTHSGESIVTRKRADPMMTLPELELFTAATYGEMDPADPLASPVFGDFSGLPPLLMMAGDREMLLSDSVRCVEQALAVGVDATLHVAPKMHHDWVMFPIPESKPAIAMIAAHCQ